MHKAIFKKLKPISLGILAPLGCLTTSFTHANTHVSTQSNRSLSANDIQDNKVTKVEDSTKAADSNTLLPIEIRIGQRSNLSESLSLLRSVRIENTVSSNNRQGDIRLAELCSA